MFAARATGSRKRCRRRQTLAMAPTALKLRFAPDEYLVTWQLPSVGGEETMAAHGALTVEAGRPPKGIAHGDLYALLEHPAPGATGFPQIVTVPRLTGNMANGACVLLLNAVVNYWISNQASVYADAAVITLASVTGARADRFKTFEIQVGGLDAVSGVELIKSTTFPKQGMGGTWSAEIVSDSAQTWEDETARLTLSYNGTFHSFDPYAFRMGFSPVLRGELATAIPLSELLKEWISPIRRVVSIATGRAEDLTYAALYLSTTGGDVHGQLFGSSITQEPYESSLEKIRKVSSPLHLKADAVSLLKMIRNWQEMASAHHPLLETYGEMLHASDQHPRSRFLLLLQAIEGTHGVETKASFARRLKKHTQDRTAVVEAAAGLLDDKQLKFLEKNLSKRPLAGLESAINWLANLLPGDPMARLNSTSLIAAKKAPTGEARNAPDALRIIRNDLAHGNRGYDAHELDEVVRVLEMMVRAHALDLLGCTEAVVKRVLAADR
jgi:hypothetical protein